jgi:nicotinamidase-related amidase
MPHRAALLVVDLQDKLLPTIHDADAVVRQSERLIRGFATLDLPVMATEQNPTRLGPTVEPIAAALPPGDRPSKLKFSACVEDVRKWLEAQRRDTVVLCGIESHVCVLQTALELLSLGMVVAVAVDAVGSRRPLDHGVAMQRMVAAGVIPVTVEMALLELVHEAGTDRFKRILPLIKAD